MSFIYLGVSESLLGRKNMNVMYWKLCLMKAKAMFAVLVLSKQQAKLTEFQLIFDVVVFFFFLFYFITGKGEGINMHWINLK